MNFHSLPSARWKYLKSAVFIAVVIIVFAFLLIPQFWRPRQQASHIQGRLEKATHQVEETQRPTVVPTATYVDSTTNMEFVLVKGGCFDMGDTFGDGDADEKPVHRVCLDDFYIGKYEVTVAQWNAVMIFPQFWRGRSQKCEGNCPVQGISWDKAQAFIGAFNKKSRKRYRLPTEAEWEYAARSGGKKEKWAGTSDEMQFGTYAWYDKNSGDMVHPVGQKKSNDFGLYDMCGNVWEWVEDWYESNYYSQSKKNNPQGPNSGLHRVQRGGSWFYRARDARTSARAHLDPGRYRRGNDLFGFRLALTH